MAECDSALLSWHERQVSPLRPSVLKLPFSFRVQGDLLGFFHGRVVMAGHALASHVSMLGAGQLASSKDAASFSWQVLQSLSGRPAECRCFGCGVGGFSPRCWCRSVHLAARRRQKDEAKGKSPGGCEYILCRLSFSTVAPFQRGPDRGGDLSGPGCMTGARRWMLRFGPRRHPTARGQLRASGPAMRPEETASLILPPPLYM